MKPSTNKCARFLKYLLFSSKNNNPQISHATTFPTRNCDVIVAVTIAYAKGAPTTIE